MTRRPYIGPSEAQSQADADRRTSRDRPYAAETMASSARRHREPLHTLEFLTWFLEGWRAELPETLHVNGVWFGRPDDDLPLSQSGGSLLGTPKDSPPFRQFMEDRPTQSASDGQGEFYLRPMRAALHRLAGPKLGSDSALMARYLAAVASCDGDWDAVASRWGIPPYIRLVYLDCALRRLYRAYRGEPPARLLPRAGYVEVA